MSVAFRVFLLSLPTFLRSNSVQAPHVRVIDTLSPFFAAPIGKRGWKMFYAVLRDMVLYLHKSEHVTRKAGVYNSVNNAVRIHHALATKATDYTKKRHVFRLQTADWAQYLFQTR